MSITWQKMKFGAAQPYIWTSFPPPSPFQVAVPSLRLVRYLFGRVSKKPQRDLDSQTQQQISRLRHFSSEEDQSTQEDSSGSEPKRCLQEYKHQRNLCYFTIYRQSSAHRWKKV